MFKNWKKHSLDGRISLIFKNFNVSLPALLGKIETFVKFTKKFFKKIKKPLMSIFHQYGLQNSLNFILNFVRITNFFWTPNLPNFWFKRTAKFVNKTNFFIWSMQKRRIFLRCCQNEVALNCIWLILPSVSEPFAHFWMFFHLLHFTTPHFLCHKRLILLSSTKTIVPPNRQVQKPSLSCKKPAWWFIKILSNRDSKMMQDFLWKGGSIL